MNREVSGSILVNIIFFYINEEEVGSELGSGSELGNLFAQEGGLTIYISRSRSR